MGAYNMDTLFIIIITGFAVIGAYFIAEIILGGEDLPCKTQAVVILPNSQNISDALRDSYTIRKNMPAAVIIAVADIETEKIPLCGCYFDNVYFVSKEELNSAVYQSLQTIQYNA